VCNHQSFVDPTLITYPLAGTNFKCLFKHSLLYAPGIGSTLALAGHIPVNRGDGCPSRKAALARADAALAGGTSVVFFVEGTRKIDTAAGPLGDFKPGAFLAAQKAGVRIVPMTISGARRLFPPGVRLMWGDVTITVHAPLPPPARDGNKDAADASSAVNRAMAAARTVIASALRDVDVTPARAPAGGAAAAAGGAAGAGGAGGAAAAAAAPPPSPSRGGAAADAGAGAAAAGAAGGPAIKKD